MLFGRRAGSDRQSVMDNNMDKVYVGVTSHIEVGLRFGVDKEAVAGKTGVRDGRTTYDVESSGQKTQLRRKLVIQMAILGSKHK